MSTETPPTEPRRTAPLALWRVAQAFLVTLHVLFGAPEDVAARRTLKRRLAAQMYSWLRAGEALMRKLLLIEAAELTPTAPRAHGTSRELHQRCETTFDPNLPAQWRAPFRCFADGAASRAAKRERRPRHRNACPLDCDAQPIARRYEALLRVFNDPAPYAARLARLLRARPQRVQSILLHRPDAPKLVGREDFDQVSDAADTAALQRRRDSG